MAFTIILVAFTWRPIRFTLGSIKSEPLVISRVLLPILAPLFFLLPPRQRRVQLRIDLFPGYAPVSGAEELRRTSLVIENASTDLAAIAGYRTRLDSLPLVSEDDVRPPRHALLKNAVPARHENSPHEIRRGYV